MRRRNEKETWLLEKPPRGERERERIVCMHCFFPSPLAPLFSPLRLIPILFFRKKKKRNRLLEKNSFPVSIKSLGSGERKGKHINSSPKSLPPPQKFASSRDAMLKYLPHTMAQPSPDEWGSRARRTVMLPLKESAGWLCHEFRAIFVSPRREVYYLPLFSSSSSSPHYEHVSAILFRSPEEDERQCPKRASSSFYWASSKLVSK